LGLIEVWVETRCRVLTLINTVLETSAVKHKYMARMKGGLP